MAYADIESIRPNPKNARKHPRHQIRRLAESIRAFGFNAPILIGSDGKVIAGHARLEAAKLLGLTQVPTICLDHLDEVRSAAYMLADNKFTDISSWDDVVLAENLKELSHLSLDFPLEATGFETSEIDLKILSLGEPGSSDPVDEVVVPDDPPVSQVGDLFTLGDHTVCCGSALDAASYKRMPDAGMAAMVFTDPPYNVKINGHVSGLGEIKHREFVEGAGEKNSEEFSEFLAKALKAAASHCAPGALLYVFMDWAHQPELHKAAQSCELNQINLCVWVKTNGGMGSYYRSRHELISVLRCGGAHRNNVQLGRAGRNRTNVWNYPGANVRVKGKRALDYHPTPKPITLVADAILDCTRPGDLILDPFLGSGTTILAAEKTRRKAHGIELDPIYVDVAIQRWQRMTGRDAIHTETGKTYRQLRTERLGHV
jgi:DNA modification methylase